MPDPISGGTSYADSQATMQANFDKLKEMYAEQNQAQQAAAQQSEAQMQGAFDESQGMRAAGNAATSCIDHLLKWDTMVHKGEENNAAAASGVPAPNFNLSSDWESFASNENSSSADQTKQNQQLSNLFDGTTEQGIQNAANNLTAKAS